MSAVWRRVPIELTAGEFFGLLGAALFGFAVVVVGSWYHAKLLAQLGLIAAIAPVAVVKVKKIREMSRRRG